MAIKAHTIRTPKRRVNIFEDWGFKIQSFDTDNLYPQRMELFAGASPMADSCVATKAKFIRGEGFEDASIDERKVNSQGQKFIQIKRQITRSIALNRGFCLHFNYNALLEIASISFIPWKYARLGPKDSAGLVSKIHIWSDWEMRRLHKNEKTAPQVVDCFNPDPEAVAAQIELAGGLEKYRGQALYWTEEGFNTYVTSTIDAVIDDVRADASSAAFAANSADNNFVPSSILGFPEQETEEEENAIRNEVSKFQGTEDANSVLLLFGVDDETKPFFEKYEQQNFDGRLKQTREDAKAAIMQKFGQTPALKGVLVPGKLGSANEIATAFSLYNTHTQEERADFESILADIDKHTAPGIRLSASGNYKVIPLRFGAENEQTTQASDPEE
jgi:hypothetical protein